MTEPLPASPFDSSRSASSGTNDSKASEQKHLGDVGPATYAKMREIAGSLMKSERPDHTLTATALANEAWVKLKLGGHEQFNDRRHLLMTAACTMRQLLVDSARRRNTEKRGGQLTRLELTEAADRILTGTDPALTIDVDAALEKLGETRSELVDIVVYKMFGGMTNAEIADCVGRSLSSVEKDWATARAFLMAYINRHQL